jgi:hypothetical protein
MLGKIGQAAKAVTDKVGDVFGAGFDKVKAQLDELAAASGALAQVGYRFGDIDVEVSIPPRLTVHLIREHDATDEAFQAVLANNAGNRTFCIVVGLLRQANRLVSRVTIKGRRLHAVEVGLGLIPSIKLKYAEQGVKPPTGEDAGRAQAI